MKKDIIQILEDSINNIHYQKYLRILAEVNKYKMYTNSNLDIHLLMRKLRIPIKFRSLIMVGSSSVPLKIYDKIIKFIQNYRRKKLSVSYTSFDNIFRQDYMASTASKNPIHSNIQMSQCYVAPNKRYVDFDKPIYL